MKKFLFITFLALSQFIVAQGKGTLRGLLTDKEVGGEPLPFANVFIKGTTIGATTDFDGNFVLSVPAGTHTVIFSFVGYKTIQRSFTISEGQTVTLNEQMSAAEGVGLDEVIIKTTTNRGSTSALLTEQKKSIVIKESIGTEQLDKIGVSDAAVATSKISGVTKSGGSSSAVFIRGLGDRYLSTTMNGLPIPSDDVDKKNISLDLFSTDVLESVSIAKTYAADSYGDQSSGHIDIISKQFNSGTKKLKVGLSSGTNTNVIEQFGDFRTSPNLDDSFLGFHKSSPIKSQLTQQTWNPVNANTPLNYGFSLSGGGKLGKVSLSYSLSNSKSHNYRGGIFRIIDENTIKSYYSKVDWYGTDINTTALLDLNYKTGDNNFKLVSLFVNKLSDDLVELGRDTRGYVFDQFPFEDGAFIRDQNTKQSRILVEQLIGKHDLTENNTLNWALGFNLVGANEPNRIRNEANIGLGGLGERFTGERVDNTIPVGSVQFAHNSPFQSRKSSQEISDIEFNGLVNDKIVLVNEDDYGLTINYGANVRSRSRDFESIFAGVSGLRNLRVNSVDNFDQIINANNFANGVLRISPSLPDIYNANLNIYSFYASSDMRISKSTTLNLGIRYEQDEYDLNWDVQNFVDPVTFLNRVGSLKDTYKNVLGNVNVKQQLNEKSSIKFAYGHTVTLPEFKELAPFEYVTPTGRIIRGNPNLSPSTNFNFDLKWELFPSKEQLISVTGFYKIIEDPINFSILPSAAGTFSYANTGNKADVYGVELESRFNVIDLEDLGNIKFTGNLALMSHTQDISANFQYKNVTRTGLQGASDVVANASLVFDNNGSNGIEGSISANYKSDNIYALGAPRDQADRGINYNDQIIEKGLVTLDAVLSKQIGEHFKMKAVFKNLLNPTYRQTQNLGIIEKDLVTGKNLLVGEQNLTIDSFKKGIDMNIGISYSF